MEADHNRRYYEDLVEGFRSQVADLERQLDEQTKLADDRGDEVRGRGEDLRKYEAGLERVVRALYDGHAADNLLLEEEVAAVVAPVVVRISMLRLLASGGPIPIDALEAFLKRHTERAETEAEPLRSVRLGFVQDLAALMVRHCAPRAVGLLGGTALVEPAEIGRCSCGAVFMEGSSPHEHECPLDEPLNPGETRECGAVLPHDGGARSRFRCGRPVGHEGHHLSAQGDTWGPAR